MADLSGLSDEQLQAYKDLLIQKQSPALKDAQAFSDRGGTGAPPTVAPPRIPKELRHGPVDQFGIPPSVKPLGGPVAPIDAIPLMIAGAGADALDKLTHSGVHGDYHGLGGPILPPEGLSLPVGEGATSPLPGVGRFSNFFAPETHPALPEDLSMGGGSNGPSMTSRFGSALRATTGMVNPDVVGIFSPRAASVLRTARRIGNAIPEGKAAAPQQQEPVYMGAPRDMTLPPSGTMGRGVQTGFGPSPQSAPLPVETGGAHIPNYVHPLPQPGEETELFRPATFAPSSRSGGTMGRGVQSGFGPSPKTMRPPVETGGAHIPDYTYRGTPPKEEQSIAPEPVAPAAPTGTTSGSPVFGKSYGKPSPAPITGGNAPGSALINARAFEQQQNRLANAPITTEDLATLPIEELRKMVPHLSDEEFEQGIKNAVHSGQVRPTLENALENSVPSQVKVRRRGVGQ